MEEHGLYWFPMNGSSAGDERSPAQGALADGILDELMRRIVDTVHPLRIVLFGSSVRNDRGPDSDIDLLIVMPDGIHRRRTAQAIHLCLSGIGVAKDVIVVTESDVRDFGDNPSLVICPALREGKELYRAAG